MPSRWNLWAVTRSGTACPTAVSAGLAIDLRSADARQAFYGPRCTPHAVVDNSRLGGISGWSTMRPRHGQADIVTMSVNGFGEQGPMAMPGLDPCAGDERYDVRARRRSDPVLHGVPVNDIAAAQRRGAWGGLRLPPPADRRASGCGPHPRLRARCSLASCAGGRPPAARVAATSRPVRPELLLSRPRRLGVRRAASRLQAAGLLPDSTPQRRRRAPRSRSG
jgi:hypothetical protein